jgi:hypothetical protein
MVGGFVLEPLAKLGSTVTDCFDGGILTEFPIVDLEICNTWR